MLVQVKFENDLPEPTIITGTTKLQKLENRITKDIINIMKKYDIECFNIEIIRQNEDTYRISKQRYYNQYGQNGWSSGEQTIFKDR